MLVRMCWLGLAALALALYPALATAQLVNENLLVSLPDGYKTGFQKKTAEMLMVEMVPNDQTVEAWTEMVTVQIFFNVKQTPDQFRARMDKLWTTSCPEARPSAVITDDPANGYPASLWLLACPNNKATGKPEITWFKAIQGNDSFYVVQKAFKFMPPTDATTPWITFLQKVSVCDSRRKDRACPT